MSIKITLFCCLISTEITLIFLHQMNWCYVLWVYPFCERMLQDHVVDLVWFDSILENSMWVTCLIEKYEDGWDGPKLVEVCLSSAGVSWDRHFPLQTTRINTSGWMRPYYILPMSGPGQSGSSTSWDCRPVPPGSGPPGLPHTLPALPPPHLQHLPQQDC